MTYQVKLTNNAIEQLEEAVEYISKVLHEPEVARHWVNRLKKEISSLSLMPFRNPLVEEEPWRKEGVRKLPVENFIVYYLVNEAASAVWVIAVVYGRRDQLSALCNIP